MICNNCGKTIPDGARFCDGCGAAMPAPQPVQQQPAPQPVYQQPVYQQPVYQQPVYQQPVYQQPVYQQPAYQQPVYQQPASPIRPPVHYSVAPAVLDVDSPSLSAMKKLIKSPLAIITVLLMIAQITIGIIMSMDLVDMGNVLLRNFGFTDIELVYTGSNIDIGSIVTVLAFCICIGCAFAKKGYCTAGLVIFKVMTIIAIVVVSLTGAAILVVEALMYNDAYALLTEVSTILPGEMEIMIINPEEFKNACLIIIGVTIVILGLVILYFARVLGMLNAATQIAKTGRTKKKASVYVAIICIVGGIFALMTAAVQAVYLSSIPGVAELELPILKIVAPALLSGVESLMLGSLILTYRNTVQPLAGEAPMVQIVPPVVEVPAVQVPAVETPVVNEPVFEAPAVEEPVVEESMFDATILLDPVIEEPVAEESVFEATMLLDPVIEEPVIEEPVIEEPVIEEPVIEEPVVEEPVIVAPVVEEPVIVAPVVEEPVIVAPVVEEPVIAAPVVEEPLVVEPVVAVPQAEFAFCGYCGKKVLTTAKFCPYCGKAR